MERVATSVRIAGDAIGSLSRLSVKLQRSEAQVIEAALKEMEDRIFWEEVRVAFDETAVDPAESAGQTAEMQAHARFIDRSRLRGPAIGRLEAGALALLDRYLRS